MTQEEKYEMGQRIKEEIKEKYKTIGNLNEELEYKNLAAYTAKAPREPRATVLAKLLEAGLDVEYILGGKKVENTGINISGDFSGDKANIVNNEDGQNISGDNAKIINQREGQRMVMGDHNGNSYSSDIVDTLKSVINSQQEMLKQYSNQITEMSSTMKEMKVVMEKHSDEGHEYMVKMSHKFGMAEAVTMRMDKYLDIVEEKWIRVDKFVDANQKQVAITKKNKGIWEKHIEEHQTKTDEIWKIVKEIKDNK